MTYGATKAEFADRIDKLNDLVEAEREMRASMTKFEQAQRDVVVAAEHLQEWASRWEDCKQSVLAFVTDEYLTALKATECKLADADEVLRAFCDKVKLQQAAIAALGPAPAEPEAEPVLYSIDEQTCEPVDPRCGAPAEQAPAKDTDDRQDNRRRFAHPTRFEDGPLGVSFNADDVIPDWLLLPDYVWTTQADGSVLVTPQAPALADPLSAELRSDLPASEEESRDQIEDEPDVFISILTGDPAISPESGLHGEPEPTELDAPASIVDDPELLAAVARAEATLQEAEPAYVGLQDPDLDAEYDAMKEREKADKPKLHFSIFGERGNRKLEEVE